MTEVLPSLIVWPTLCSTPQGISAGIGKTISTPVHVIVIAHSEKASIKIAGVSRCSDGGMKISRDKMHPYMVFHGTPETQQGPVRKGIAH